MSLPQNILKKVVSKLISTTPKYIPSDLNFKISFCDVGSADGLPQEARWLSPILDVIGFEPDPRSIVQTEQKLKELNTGSCSLINKAVDEKPGQRTLYLTNKPQCSSFYQPNLNILENFPESSRFNIERSVNLDCIPLADLQKQIDWLKIDTQGSELPIIKGLGGKIADVTIIDVEIEILEMYSGQPLLKDMLEYLMTTHQIIRFDVVNWRGISHHGDMEILMNSKGRSVFANSLWLKKGLLPESFESNDKAEIMKAILVLLSYRQFSLAHQISDIAVQKNIITLDEKIPLFNVFDKSSLRFLIGKIVSSLFGVNRMFAQNRFNFDEE